MHFTTIAEYSRMPSTRRQKFPFGLAPSGNPAYAKMDSFGEIHMDAIDRNIETAIRRFLSLISGRYDTAGAILYGSRARGTHRPDSDADVAVLLRGQNQPFLSAKLEMADTAFDVMLETNILVSPLPIWVDEWEHPESYSNPDLLRHIDREGVRL